MVGQKRRVGVLAMAFFMLLSLLPQSGAVLAADRTLICENYTDTALTGTDVGALGWTKTENLSWVNPGSTKVAIEEGGLQIQKAWSNAEGRWNYAMRADKKLEAVQQNHNGDPRVTVRRSHFKGVYDLSLTSLCSTSDQGIYENFCFAQTDGTANDFYLEQYANGTLNIAGQNVTLATDMSGEQSYRLRFDFTAENNGFQLFREGSDEPITVNGVNRFPMSKTTQALSPLPSYLTGLFYYLQARDSYGAGITLKKLELTEIERTEDITDAAVAALDMSVVTDAPEAVTGALKALPTSLSGANISWTSSAPDIISNDGQTVTASKAGDATVIMTATVQNPADGFTQYVDFYLTVPGESGTTILYENYTNGSITAAELSDLGWSVPEPSNAHEASSYGSFGVEAENGLTIQKTVTAISTAPTYLPSFRMKRVPLQALPQYNGNERMTVRRTQLKGLYDLELDMAQTVTAGNLMHYFSYKRTDGSTGDFYFVANKNNTFKLDGTNVVLSPESLRDFHTYTIRFDFTAASPTAQIILDHGAAATDAFPMVNAAAYSAAMPSYLTDFYFHFQRANNKDDAVSIRSLKLVERERTSDVTDAAIDALSQIALSDTPDAVTADLTLPGTAGGLAVTWTSDSPTVISNEGKVLSRPLYAPKQVVMTAKVENPTDGYTQYADFYVTVEPAAARIAPIRLVMTDEAGNEIADMPTDGSAVSYKAETTIEKAYTAKSLRLFVATYQNDRLVEVADCGKAVTDGSENVSMCAVLAGVTADKADSVRAFLWDDTMQPIAVMAERQIRS